MPHHTENTLKVNIPAAKVWEVLADYARIENFASTIISSPIVGDIQSGLGAQRRCTFNNDTSLVETIVEYKEGEGYRMEISEHSLPLKSMFAEMSVRTIDAKSSEIRMSADFVVKAGPFGWIMGKFMMRPVMKLVFKNVMSGLAYHCATGEKIGEELPKIEKFNGIIIA